MLSMKILGSTKILLVAICTLLTILPFVWFKPGELDLGGDSTRLYFYDPANYLWNNGLFYIWSWGTGLVESNFFYFPFVAFLLILKSILQSSYVLISLFSSLKLVVGFLSFYGILKILLGEKDKNEYSSKLVEFSSILGGLFYILSPFLIKDGLWVSPIISHNQVFLNPLMFYLLLQFFLAGNYRYLLIALFVSFIFSPNFAWGAAPPFFAFYPLAMIFLALYVVLIRKKHLPWKGMLIGLLLFLGLHAFHLVPAAIDLLYPGTNTNTRVFSRESIAAQLNYYYGVIGFAKASVNMLSITPLKEFVWASVLTPAVVISGFLLNKRKKKTVLLTGIFFLVTFFLLTANITHLGVKFYEKLFYVPGFSMFRNFIVQWRFVYAFFYALLFGQALFLIITQIKKRYIKILLLILGVFIALNAWPFINGELVTKRQFSTEVKTGVLIDPQFEALLSFLRSQKVDAKVLTLPFTDSYMQPLWSKNNAWYIGPSMISNLTGKRDFAGYQIMPPFINVFLHAAKNNDYKSLKRLMGLLNIRYIFLNQDTKIYDAAFSDWLFSYVRHYLPNDQKEYAKFVKKLTDKKVFESGQYKLYTIEDKAYLPHFYVAKTISMYEDTVDDWNGKTYSFFIDKKNDEVRTAFVEKGVCVKLFSEKTCTGKNIFSKNTIPKIEFQKINPTKYKIKVHDAKGPYMLVFSEAFYNKWKIFISPTPSLKEEIPVRTYFDGDIRENASKNVFFDNKIFETIGMKSIPDGRHMLVNGYANAWYIMPEDVDNKSDYEFIIEMVGQRVFYISLGISLFVFIFCLLWGLKLIADDR